MKVALHTHAFASLYLVAKPGGTDLAKLLKKFNLNMYAFKHVLNLTRK